MAKVLLLADGPCGLQVARFLRESGDEIVRLYLHPADQRKNGPQIIAASGCSPDQICEADALQKGGHAQDLEKAGAEYLITVYWAHLVPEPVIRAASKGTVNFHPSLLPVNRGWYPHVFSILEGTPTGVTLHALEVEADTGPVWAQCEVPLEETDTAHTIYQRLQAGILELFQETWPRIKSGEIKPVPQDHSRATYHRKRDVEPWDRLDPEAEMKVKDVIRRLKARSFGDKGFAYYEHDGGKVYLNLRLSRDTDFNHGTQ